MPRLLLTLIISFSCLNLFSQNNIPAILKQKEILVEYYEMTIAGSKVLYLPMEYGKSDFTHQQKAVIKDLENTNIVRVDLVYSDYPNKMDFSPLTKKRLETLQKILPKVLASKNTEFRKIRQTIGKTKDVASSLEHGFFIYFRPLPTKASGKKEAGKLKRLLADRTLDKSDSTDTTNIFWCWQSTIVSDTTGINLPELPEGASRTVSKVLVKDAVVQELIGKEQEKEYLELGDSLFVIEDRQDDCNSTDGSYFIYDLTDTTVSEVFKRHKWNNSFVIADVTGSMYPYTGQLLTWLKLNLTDKTKRHFLFFNDGDDKDDDKKIIGKTGGIYSVFTNSYDEVEKTIMKAMENGGGGDAPENNIEALIESNKICTSCDSIVMIADNWAPIKDLSLLTSYNKPVKVVLCGVFGKINKDYLKLARDTKGSIHLIEEDIYTLAELKEGETIKIHGATYKLIKGEFIDVTPVSL